eukprot:1361004-Amorphochlora_amoeboformis.AAC.1
MASEVPEIVLDGLPYIDKEYSNPALKSLVDKMVKEEMRSFRPPDYLASMPMPDTRQVSSPSIISWFRPLGAACVCQTRSLGTIDDTQRGSSGLVK